MDRELGEAESALERRDQRLVLRESAAAGQGHGGDRVGDELRREREGADRHAEGREAGGGGHLGDRVEVGAVEGQKGSVALGAGPVQVVRRGRGVEVERVGRGGFGPDPVHQVGLLEAQVHEGDGQGRAVALGRLPHHAGQAAPVEPNRLGVGTLVEDEVGPDRRAQPGRGERAEVTLGEAARGGRGGHGGTARGYGFGASWMVSGFGAGLGAGAFGATGAL